MDTVTIQELRDHGGELIDRVVAGEHLMVTRDGCPVAELRPAGRRGIGAAALLERWNRVPALDAARFRADLADLLGLDLTG